MVAGLWIWRSWGLRLVRCEWAVMDWRCVVERGERVERVAVHSEEAERGLLGACILEADRMVGVALGRMRMRAEEFYVPAHREVFAALREMHEAGRPIDILTVTEWLQARGRLEAVGGISGLERLVEGTPTAKNGEFYGELVREKFWVRGVLEAAQNLSAWAWEGKQAQELVSRGLQALQEIGQVCVPEGRSNLEVFDALLGNWKRARDLRRDGGEHLPGLRTPYRRLNEILGGYQPGLHFFGGKSSAGKTSLVLNICKQFLLDGKAGLMIQLDDTHEDVVGRLVAMLGGASLPALTQGFAKERIFEKLEEEIRPIIGALPLHVVEECVTVEEARNLARFYKARHGIEWVVIDYVQVLDAEGTRGDDERIRLGKIAAACKRLWKELRIPVLVVSQTAKYKDSEDDGMRADMADLFGASELFHAATTVLILKQAREKEGKGAPLTPIEWAIDDTGHTKRVAVCGHVVKNKHGPRDCQVMFWGLFKYFQFTETRIRRMGGIDRQLTWQEDRALGLEDEAKSASKTSGGDRDEVPDWAEDVG